jgi:glucan phosphoethanolaminetransferase (alkaline phosphatase superfamily)
VVKYKHKFPKQRWIVINPVYGLQVLVAMGCVLLPVGLQGHFDFVESGIGYYLLWTVFLTALWLRCRLPVQWCLPAVWVACVYSGYVLTQRDDIGYNEVSAILNTKMDEALTFVCIPSIALSLGVALIVFTVLSWALCSKWLRAKTVKPLRLNTIILYGVMASCGWAYLMTGSGWNKQQMYPINVVHGGYQFIHEVQYARNRYARLHYTYAGPDASQGPPALTVVMVIGESARAASWSLYGYERPTNPQVADCLGKSGGHGVVFLDALAAGRLTMNAAPSMLSPTLAKDFHDYCSKPSVIRVFRAAGYRTAVISSQIRTSEFWDGPVNLMLNDAASVEKFDQDDLLPDALDRWLGHDPQPRQLAVVHLAGSHYIYSDRYPESFKLFHGGNEMVDTYDNSIAFTDHVLADIITRINAMPAPAVMFYSSDHGENLNDFADGNIQHSCRMFTRYEIEVPMLFYANQAFAAAYPQQMAAILACENRPVCHDNISQTMLGLAGLADPQVYLPECDMSNKLFAPQPRFLIKNLRECVAEADLRVTAQCRRLTPKVRQPVAARPTVPPAAGGDANPLKANSSSARWRDPHAAYQPSPGGVTTTTRSTPRLENSSQ